MSASVDITVDGTQLNVELESPTLQFTIETPQILIPSGDVALVGPQGPPGPAGAQGAPSTVPGPPGPPAQNSAQIFATHWPALSGDSGYTQAQSDPFWASIGSRFYFVVGGVLQGSGRVTAVDHVGFVISFDSWTPGA